MNQPGLGKKILELRLSKGLTQTELAEKCGLSLRTIQRIESAEVIPRSYTVKTILACLGSDYDALAQELSAGAAGSINRESPPSRSLGYIRELFNLKTNTMKKVSLMTLIAVLILSGSFLAHSSLKAQQIDGWFMAGSAPQSYKMALDETVYKTPGSSALLESIDKKIDGFGTIMQSCSAEEYLGKRVKMTAWVKSKDVMSWAGMWFRVDGKTPNNILSFDNMGDRPIKGTNDWTLCEIVLDVPKESTSLNFGILLNGTGKVWFDDVKFEVVDESVKQTSSGYINKKPTNLDFGKGKK